MHYIFLITYGQFLLTSNLNANSLTTNCILGNSFIASYYFKKFTESNDINQLLVILVFKHESTTHNRKRQVFSHQGNQRRGLSL